MTKQILHANFPYSAKEIQILEQTLNETTKPMGVKLFQLITEVSEIDTDLVSLYNTLTGDCKPKGTKILDSEIKAAANAINPNDFAEVLLSSKMVDKQSDRTILLNKIYMECL